MSTQERTAELLRQLDSSVDALTDSDAWRRYLEMQARLHKYSFGNCLLIGAQCPSATYVAGYQRWLELHRYVRKGEHGIRILVPYVFHKAAQSESGEETDATYVRFGVGHVFDIAQTDGEDITQWGSARGDATVAADGLAKLEAIASGLSYVVSRERLGGSLRGYCDHKARRIVLDSELDTADQVATLAHELAHAALHDGLTPAEYHETRGRYEVEAEAVAYVVVVGLGLDADGSSLPYIADWASHSDDPKAVRTLGERVHKAASDLLGGIAA